MNISSLATNRNAASVSPISMLLNSTVVAYNNNSDTSRNAGNTGSTGNALNAVQKRVQAEVDSTKAQLSSFGVLKSALSQSQSAAQSVGKLTGQSSDSDVTRAMGGLFNSNNAVVTASKSASGGNGDSTGAASRAARVGKDFQRSLSTGSATDALKTLGISVQSDGTWVQDAKKFADALKADPKSVIAAMSKVSSAMNTVAGKELDQSGNVGSALNQLNQRSTSLAAQQQALTNVAQSLAMYKANSR